MVNRSCNLKGEMDTFVFIKTIYFCIMEHHPVSERTMYRMGGITTSNISDKDLISRICERAPKA